MVFCERANSFSPSRLKSSDHFQDDCIYDSFPIYLRKQRMFLHLTILICYGQCCKNAVVHREDRSSVTSCLGNCINGRGRLMIHWWVLLSGFSSFSFLYSSPPFGFCTAFKVVWVRHEFLPLPRESWGTRSVQVHQYWWWFSSEILYPRIPPIKT